jgi:hypothetical protein
MGESLDGLAAAYTRAVAVLWRCGDTLRRAPVRWRRGNPPAGSRGCGTLPPGPHSCGTLPHGAARSQLAASRGRAVAARCLTGPRGRSSLPHGATRSRHTAPGTTRSQHIARGSAQPQLAASRGHAVATQYPPGPRGCVSLALRPRGPSIPPGTAQSQHNASTPPPHPHTCLPCAGVCTAGGGAQRDAQRPQTSRGGEVTAGGGGGCDDATHDARRATRPPGTRKSDLAIARVHRRLSTSIARLRCVSASGNDVTAP